MLTTAPSALGPLGRSRNPRVFLDLAGPAVRGLLLKKGKRDRTAQMPAHHQAHFDWDYERNRPELAKLYDAAKRDQWDGATALPWSTEVDPFDESRELMPEHTLPLAELPSYRSLPRRRQAEQRADLTSWLLSQFLHGEQGALFAACQVTEAVQWMDGKLYGSTQVVDEGRHVEVFHRYLAEKLGKVYPINDNLYTIIDALMTDGRWDLKFLGMQIMIEGLALGAFGTMRQSTREPLLKELLQYVITDEARHVTFGVVALRDYYAALPEHERRDREDWAYEISVLLRNRFLAHEFYEEHYAHCMSRREWNAAVLRSEFMGRFRNTLFRRLIPNLKRIHLLSDRIRPHYGALGLLVYEHDKPASELRPIDLLECDPAEAEAKLLRV
ncbi:ferritin-like domain-containing protein [Paraliomyxa miuraensis]|uniref:ferritin-like domain-containing protein n=1 Tax=Paraliomyxa miuraensis TaxID=376150 RepID=UPI00224F1D14|nr:ferritin-like domain-containing protein [Paraliomyxa miuraensis]MCX4242107.1 ferritin-like domain-containing protein [Paraliomyxa miuraensis]